MTILSGNGSFTGRTEAVSEIVRALAGERTGALLTGPSGIGKTYLAAGALNCFRQDSYIIQLRGSDSVARMRYGILNVLLSELDPRSLEHPVLVFSGVLRLLRSRAEGKPVYLVIDNASEVDELAAVTVAQLVRTGEVRLLLICNDAGRLPSEFSGLCKDGLLTRIAAKPLTYRQALQWLEACLGARVSPTAAWELWTASCGNPQFLRMLSEDLSGSGALANRDGSWVLVADDVGHGRRTTDLLAAGIGRIADGEQRILEILSLAEALPLETLLRLVDADGVDSLEERGIVEIDNSMPRRVRMQSRLLRQIVSERVPPGRSDQLRKLVIRASEGSMWPETSVSLAAWTLSCGDELSLMEATVAAGLANERLDSRLALRLVESVRGHSSLPSAVREEVRAMMNMGARDGAQKVLNIYHKSSHAEPSLSEWVGLLLAESSVLLTRPEAWEEATANLCKVRTELFPSETDPELGPVDPLIGELRAQLILGEAEASSYAGSYPQMVDNLEPLHNDVVKYDPEFRLMAGSWLAEAWALTGRHQEAMDLVTQLLSCCSELPISAETARGIKPRLLHAYVITGNWTEAAELLRIDDEIPAFGGLRQYPHELPEAVLSCMKGNGCKALELLEPAISQLRVNEDDGVLSMACAAAAYASALQGKTDQARRYLRDSQSRPYRTTRHVSWCRRYFEALSRAEIDSRQDGIGELMRLANEDRESGAKGHELFCLAAVVRLGGTTVSKRLSESAADCQGPFARLCGLFSGALIAKNPELLIAAASLAADLQHDRFAFDAAESVLMISPAPVDRALVKKAKQIAGTCRRRMGLAHDTNDLKQPLTSRELQIAKYVATGESNKSIADQLHLSVRTVEGHLYQIFGKLQISERADLIFALDFPEGELS